MISRFSSLIKVVQHHERHPPSFFDNVVKSMDKFVSQEWSEFFVKGSPLVLYQTSTFSLELAQFNIHSGVHTLSIPRQYAIRSLEGSIILHSKRSTSSVIHPYMMTQSFHLKTPTQITYNALARQQEIASVLLFHVK